MTCMDEKTYRQLLDETYARVDRAFEDVDPDLAEVSLVAGHADHHLPRQAALMLTPQPSPRQLWVAFRDRAWHFDWDEERRRAGSTTAARASSSASSSRRPRARWAASTSRSRAAPSRGTSGRTRTGMTWVPAAWSGRAALLLAAPAQDATASSGKYVACGADWRGIGAHQLVAAAQDTDPLGSDMSWSWAPRTRAWRGRRTGSPVTTVPASPAAGDPRSARSPGPPQRAPSILGRAGRAKGQPLASGRHLGDG